MLQLKYEKVVLGYYPEAIVTKDVLVKYMGKILDENIHSSKVLLATSLCSDDINSKSTGFFNVFFGPFCMGGLAGIPFAGKTGMVAFAHHIPDDGAGFIFYGPHVGITLDAELGKLYRPRIERKGESCGALMLALKRFQDNADYQPEFSADDYQQNTLESELLPFKEEILNAPNQVQAITEFAYQIIEKKIHDYLKAVKTEFQVKKLILLGGIVINTEFGLDDYFAVRNFELIDVDSL
jgi:hypothetical protein